jgi:uncharacterized membrane protein YgcG
MHDHGESEPAETKAETAAEAPVETASPEPLADAPPDIPEHEDDDPQPADEGPVHRPLIRAQLPRPEGVKIERQAPDFTIRQGGRGNANFRGGGGSDTRGRGGRGGGGGGGAHNNNGHRFGRGPNRGDFGRGPRQGNNAPRKRGR